MCLFLHQTEIAKRLNTICAQVIPFLSQEVSMCDFELRTVFLFIPFIHSSCLLALLINLVFVCVFCSISSRWSKLWSEQNRWQWQSSMRSLGYVDCQVFHPQCVYLYLLFTYINSCLCVVKFILQEMHSYFNLWIDVRFLPQMEKGRLLFACVHVW